MSVDNLAFEWVTADEIDDAIELELASFPPDEAATRDALAYRQTNAPKLFLGVFSPAPRTLIAFTCATLTRAPTLSHASMATHDPAGQYAAIHSVCVAAAYRRKGVALAMLAEYLVRLSQQHLRGARLITHDELVPLYTQASFTLVGKSDVVHGERPWWEMKADFRDEDALVPAQAQDDGVRSPGQAWSTFNGIDSVLGPSSANLADLYCPRPECRCLLLSAGAGTWVRGHSSDFILPALPHPLASAPPLPSSSGYWSVSSPLAFENIGFSRNTSAPSTPGETIKYLVCADCDHGPLGWHDTEGRDLGLEVEAENEGKQGELRRGREFLLDVERVRYRVR